VRQAGLGLATLLAVLAGGTSGTQDAIANGDTRSLTLYHTHTKERATITFRRNGQYDPRGLEQLNWMLRDWRRDEPTGMDPRLFDTLWEVYRQVGSSEPIHIASAYRSPQTNAMLRRRSNAVAKHSQHTLGKALDFYLPDVSIDRIRAVGMRLQHGGVGYYPSAYSPFIHLDVGSVRAWPRMTRDQLVRLFPDGKTVHIPADGTPLPGYELARAEVLAAGWSVGGYTAVADAGEALPGPRRKSFWATLFGFGDDDEDAEEIRTASNRETYVARRAPPPNIYSESGSSVYAALEPRRAEPVRATPRMVPVAPPPPVEAPVAQRPDQEPVSQAGPTRIAGLPGTVQTPAGPKLVWQQPPAAQAQPLPNGADDALQELALAPLPPRRPDDIVVTGTLAFAPMPPVRPGSLAATNPIPIAAASDLVVAAAAPAGHPLPPPRPALRPVAVASIGDVIALTAAADRAAPAAAAEPRVQLRPAASDTTGATRPPAEPPKARRAAPIPGGVVAAASAGLNLGFSSRPTGDLTSSRFTGPAVRPLPVLR
jgi:uncharacterized protein YcbK (DUF882 family)